MELTERRKKILQIVVDEHITDIEPVSNESEDRHFQHKPSPIRSELAALEEIDISTIRAPRRGKFPCPRLTVTT